VIRGASEDLPVPLRGSIGIVRGIATGQRDKAGHLEQHELAEPANHLADLLGEHAPPGVSWVAGGLYRLVRRDFVWGDAPTIKIPGAEERSLPADMRIYSLLRPHTREEKLLEMSSASSDLIGRDAELADLHAAYYGVVGSGLSTGQVAARVISGEMGIGKTALLTAFLNELPPDARVLRAECSPALSEVPFATVSEWVRELTGTRSDQPIEEARALISDALSELAGGDDGPEILERMAELATGRVRSTVVVADVARSRQLVSLGLRRFFARAALEAPLVIALDGLQWADRPSLKLVTEFLKRPEPLPILVLLLARPDDRIMPQLEELVRIELKGLSAEHQLRLLQSRFGVIDGVRQVCADLLPRAGGNPFFLLEMVDALLERGRFEIHERAGGGGQELVAVERPGEVALPLPSTLEQLIADRLNELPAEEQAIVEWLAVAGGPLGNEDIIELEGPNTEDAVMRLCARGLCEQKGELTDVRHPLTRDVAYRALDRRRRVRMHRKLGEYLGRTPLGKGLTAAIVARHLARGNAREEAARFFLEAADAARSSYQTQLAKRCYRRVIALLPDRDPKLIEAYEALEAISRNQGRWQERRSHLTELRRLAKLSGKAFWAATALLRTAQFELDAGQLSRALANAQRGEQMSKSSGSAVLEVGALTLMAEILHEIGDMQGALAAVDRALLASNGESAPVRLRAEALRLRGTLLRRVGRVHEAVDCQAEAIAVFRRVGARRLEARAKNSLAYALLVLGRFEDGIALALDAIRIDLSIGGRFQIARTLSTIGACYANLGDVPRGLAYLRRAREAHERYGDRDSRADTLLSTAELLLEAGDIVAGETLVGDAGALTAVTGSTFDSVHEKILRALMAYQQGDASRAVMYAFDARQAAEAQAYVAFHFYAMAIEARARVEMGENHTGILLATTAMGAIETLQGSEYGLPTRALCCAALVRAGSPQAQEIRARARAYVQRLVEHIRDHVFRDLFLRRRVVQEILMDTPTPSKTPERSLLS
jgi:tetratricopeptide (TPR) repeat protein